MLVVARSLVERPSTVVQRHAVCLLRPRPVGAVRRVGAQDPAEL